MGTSLTIASVDYQKYFDSFPTEWTHQFLLALGIPPALADMTADLYGNLVRTIRFGRALGQPFQPLRGLGQGDSMSLIPAIALVASSDTLIISTGLPYENRLAWMTVLFGALRPWCWRLWRRLQNLTMRAANGFDTIKP